MVTSIEEILNGNLHFCAVISVNNPLGTGSKLNIVCQFNLRRKNCFRHGTLWIHLFGKKYLFKIKNKDRRITSTEGGWSEPRETYYAQYIFRIDDYLATYCCIINNKKLWMDFVNSKIRSKKVFYVLPLGTQLYIIPKRV